MAAAHSVRQFVFGSTQSVYGNFDDPARVPFREEDAAIRPGLSMYAASKLATEAFLSAFADASSLGYVALRFGGLYGPRVHVDSNGGLLLQALQDLDGGAMAKVRWARNSLHTLTYVGDAATSVVRALEVQTAGTAVNVVAEPITAQVMYETLATLAGPGVSKLEWLEDRTRFQLVSAERLVPVLGMCELTPLEVGLSALIEWYRAGSGSESTAEADQRSVSSLPPARTA
jgi:UDP-glucose 4-epimerase